MRLATKFKGGFFIGKKTMTVTQGTWGSALGPISNIDVGLTERYAPWLGVNPNQPAVSSNNNSSNVLNQTLIPQQTNVPTNVLGAKDVNTGGNVVKTNVGDTSGGGGGGGSSYPADQYVGWDPIAAQADWDAKQKSGGGGVDQNQQINEMYEPYKAELERIAGELQKSQLEDIASTEGYYGKSQENIQSEKSDLLQNIKNQLSNLTESGRGAYAEATRAYNNLIQQGMSQYGGGSSVGGAISELVGQEYLRSTSGIRKQEEQGRQALDLEQNKIGTFITGKITDLDKWKDDTLASINKNFQANLSEINMRRGDIEANKTKDKMALLQNTIEQTRQVASEDRQFRLNLAQFAVEQMQAVSGNTYTPQEIAKVVNQMMGAEIQGFTGNYANAPTSVYNPKTGKEEDIYGGLVGQTG